MTEAMPFLQKAILLSYDPRPFGGVLFLRKSGKSQAQPSSLRAASIRSIPSFRLSMEVE